jgi:hypothetical protein
MFLEANVAGSYPTSGRKDKLLIGYAYCVSLIELSKNLPPWLRDLK